MSPRLLVVGGGITGLAAAWEGVCAGAEVTVVESSARWGGKVHTERADGFVVEYGPDAFVAYRPAGMALIRELGLDGDVVTVNPGRTVSIRVGGRMHPIPQGMGMVLPQRIGPFVTTGLLGWRQKLRAALDLVLPRRLGEADVSIGDFLRARLGGGVVECLADPMVGGIYGASLDELSLDAVLPSLRDNERSHRSLLLAAWAQGRGARAARTAAPAGAPASPFRSLSGGLGMLIERLVQRLTDAGATLRLQTYAVSIDPLAGGAPPTRVRFSDGSDAVFDGVILAAGAAASADLLADHSPATAAALGEIRHSSTAVVTLGYPADAFPTPVTTQGWLDAGPAPASGVTVSSVKWPGRATDGRVLVRVFVPDKVALRTAPSASTPTGAAATDADLLAQIEPYAGQLLGATRPPAFWRVTRWSEVMPKYTVGHLDRVRRAEAGLTAYPTWAVAGAALRGVGIPDCIADGRRATRAVLTALAAPTDPTEPADPTDPTAQSVHTQEPSR